MLYQSKITQNLVRSTKSTKYICHVWINWFTTSQGKEQCNEENQSFTIESFLAESTNLPKKKNNRRRYDPAIFRNSKFCRFLYVCFVICGWRSVSECGTKAAHAHAVNGLTYILLQVASEVGVTWYTWFTGRNGLMAAFHCSQADFVDLSEFTHRSSHSPQILHFT